MPSTYASGDRIEMAQGRDWIGVGHCKGSRPLQGRDRTKRGHCMGSGAFSTGWGAVRVRIHSLGLQDNLCLLNGSGRTLSSCQADTMHSSV